MTTPKDDLFVCYLCKMDEHDKCVGVPCQCDCPDPKEAGMEKCNFVGCANRGRPQPGFDFYACPSCLDRLGILIDAMQNAERSKS